ncbi:hypothetical protein BDP27DRAFT_1365593 [Rhodocollybia butyracea]|uniref:Uncharacterized protein n=1 Tax=Rhodocollybia butyracea TaxID=206335 RepID=A0A9P5PNE6_9AGAR|nr:hypothetical protein BDP27DRAFT_1365593 [Rhodocollybia butyracea]
MRETAKQAQHPNLVDHLGDALVPNYTLQLKSHYRIPSLALKLEMNCMKSTSNQQDMVPLIPQSDPSRLNRELAIRKQKGDSDTADDTNINRRILMVWMVLEPIVGNWIREGTGSIVVFANIRIHKGRKDIWSDSPDMRLM